MTRWLTTSTIAATARRAGSCCARIVEERFINLDSDVFPDGGYTIRVVASDAPSHSAEDALTGEATSARFEVDNTAPQVESLHATADGGKIHVTFRAVDSFSPISHAEYSIDAGEAQTVESVGQISDSRSESYDFTVPVPATAEAGMRGSNRTPSPRVSPSAPRRTSTPSSCASTTASTTWESARSW
jgi:hypothetical protein